MGWDGMYCSYKDRKKVVEQHLELPLIAVKKAWVGNNLYYAFKAQNGKIHGCVAITKYRDGEVLVKDMTEDMGPGYYDCPASILKILSPTDDVFAKEWRERCWKKAKAYKPKDIPIGGKIRFTMPDYSQPTGEINPKNGLPVYQMKTYVLIKRAPAYQFKTAWWWNPENNTYFSKKNIPEDFEIL